MTPQEIAAEADAFVRSRLFRQQIAERQAAMRVPVLREVLRRPSNYKLQDPELGKRSIPAEDALKELRGAPAPEARSYLVRLADSPDPNLRAIAGRYLPQACNAEDVPLLLDLLADSETAVWTGVLRGVVSFLDATKPEVPSWLHCVFDAVVPLTKGVLWEEAVQCLLRIDFERAKAFFATEENLRFGLGRPDGGGLRLLNREKVPIDREMLRRLLADAKVGDREGAFRGYVGRILLSFALQQVEGIDGLAHRIIAEPEMPIDVELQGLDKLRYAPPWHAARALQGWHRLADFYASFHKAEKLGEKASGPLRTWCQLMEVDSSILSTTLGRYFESFEVDQMEKAISAFRSIGASESAEILSRIATLKRDEEPAGLEEEIEALGDRWYEATEDRCVKMTLFCVQHRTDFAEE